MCLSYKTSDDFADSSSKRLIEYNENENIINLQKTKITINEIIVRYFSNIIIAYKSGNMIRLYNQLSNLNNITNDHYFDPSPDFFSSESNSIPDILMKISFDKSNKFSLKCKIAALSIIDNLTFEEYYGFLPFFDELDIINSACISLFSDNLNLVLYSLRILINFCETDKYFARKILLCCPLDEFIIFILNINDDDRKLKRRIKDASLSLIFELSFISSDDFTPCFYATIDYLLRFLDEVEKIEKYIFWIVINIIKSDEKYVSQFYENENLINLIIEVINNQIDSFENFKSAIILLDKLYQKADFVAFEINLSNLMQAVSEFDSNDSILFIPLLRILKRFLQQPQFFSIGQDKSFVSLLSEIFLQSQFSIKVEITELLCVIVECSPPLFLSCLIHEHVIQIIFEIYMSQIVDLKSILLNSLVKLFDSVSCLDGETLSFFSSEIDSIDFSILTEISESDDEDQVRLITHLKQSYNDFLKIEKNHSDEPNSC